MRVSTGIPVHTLTVSSVAVVTLAVCTSVRFLWTVNSVYTSCISLVEIVDRVYVFVISQNLCSPCVRVNLPTTLCRWWALIMPMLTCSSLCFVMCVNVSTMCILWQWATDVMSPFHFLLLLFCNACSLKLKGKFKTKKNKKKLGVCWGGVIVKPEIYACLITLTIDFFDRIVVWIFALLQHGCGNFGF